MTTSSSPYSLWPRLLSPPQGSAKVQLFQKSSPNITLFYGFSFNFTRSSAPSNSLPAPELDTLIPPPAGFYTLPRLRRSVSGATLTPTGQSKDPTLRCVRFLQDAPHSQSVSSIEHIRRSNSHVESIVWWVSCDHLWDLSCWYFTVPVH